MAIRILTGKDIEGMRRVGALAADLLLHVGDRLEAGMTTADIDDIVVAYTDARGARSAPKDYRGSGPVGFPRSVCTSVNEVICHGIPGPYVLKPGDIINVDVTPVLPAKRGYHGDTSATFYIGEPSAQVKHLVESTRMALEIGMAQVRHGARVGDIGAAIAQFARAQGLAVVRAFAGHGVHTEFHAEPTIPHYGFPGTGPVLRKGMCFTIEPMLNLGGPDIRMLDDGWTAITRDGSLSAQFEHTVLVTKNGCEVLTRRSRALRHSEDVAWAKLGPLASFVD
ncbi:MAG: type I methionyl aminopeptidase [Alphaproteobacteria bacterium]|nr:type I methionyl aminopeptidase [Alphaproteobacteria bacterium]MCB9796005.1 type I methionyl aminopeptidase [Alphaproteobacteria bacterium]